MKRKLFLAAIFLIATTAFGQVATPEQFDVRGIDVQDVDLSQADFYFQGPLELFVTGLRFRGESFAAVLRFDGESTFTFEVPTDTTTVGKPQALDLSQIRMEATEDGVELSRVIADGWYFGGQLIPTTPSSLALQQLYQGAAASESVRGLLREIDSLERTIETRNRSIARLNRQIDELPEQEVVTELRNQTAELETSLSDANDTISTLRSNVSEQEDRIGSLEDEVSTLEQQIANRNERITRLNEQIEELPEPETVARLREQTDALEMLLDEAQEEAVALQGVVSEQRIELGRLRERIEDLREPWMTADENLETEIPVRFATGTTLRGTWNARTGVGTELAQTDDSELYAKYAVPAVQPNSDLMYNMVARSTGEGWVGYGLHFLASGWENPRLYGLGRSYLVWITRDQGAMRTDRTYVQLYRSYDDVRMIELASVAVPSDADNDINATVYVDRSANEISILVDGVHVLSFIDDSILATGTAVALRSLGSVVFTDVSIMAE